MRFNPICLGISGLSPTYSRRFPCLLDFNKRKNSKNALSPVNAIVAACGGTALDVGGANVVILFRWSAMIYPMVTLCKFNVLLIFL
ncbi:hypothetical protein Pcar_1847 [Syntrophotalea carbinolica DSM 2380]|uniref:Uncharacterized protein n=1 Tax=Syntrophotalea carbinolica (strain DSM 2380 / NBRC 103641 / GraBd1) TaxID=338963 RepID=Q3A3G9_SYNC1|nr:hypothetical protein Pcar_1847 [Syntrophotalea carbinolica DSM 2380]